MRTRIHMSSPLVIISITILNFLNRPCLGELKEEQRPSLSNFITPIPEQFQTQQLPQPSDLAHNASNNKSPEDHQPSVSKQESSIKALIESQNIDNDFEDFEPCGIEEHHPIYRPVLAAHLDDDPNEELNSNPPTREEDPLLDESEEDTVVEDLTVTQAPTPQQPIDKGDLPPSTPELASQPSITIFEETRNDDRTFDKPSNVVPSIHEAPSTNQLVDTPSIDIPDSNAQQEQSSNDVEQPLEQSPEPKLPVEQTSETTTETSTVSVVELPLDPMDEAPSVSLEKDNPESPVITIGKPESPVITIGKPESPVTTVAQESGDKSDDHDTSQDLSLLEQEDGTSSAMSYSNQSDSDRSWVQYEMDPKILIYTLFCITCVSMMNLGKWLVMSNKTTKISPSSSYQNSVVSLKNSKSLQNLQNQANRLKILNHKLAKQIDYQKKLDPIRNEIKALRDELGCDLKMKVANRKLYLKDLQKVLSLREKQYDLEERIQRFKHEQLVMIRNFIDIDNLMDLLKDIEFQGLCNGLRDSILRKKVEMDFYREQIDIFRNISKQLRTQYDQFCLEIAHEEKKEIAQENDLSETKISLKHLDENDSIDSWKRKIAEKITQTDKFYSDYYYNYRYLHEMLQVA